MFTIKFGLIVIAFSVSSMVSAATLWGYSGGGAPENWATLSPDYSSCAGVNQSPINIQGTIDAQLTPIKFNYGSDARDIENNGHTVQVNYQTGSSITIDELTFDLVQFHFHAPSENNIDGKSYPIEVHLVHSDQEGNLAVVAVLIDLGNNNDDLTNIWQSMPKHSGITQELTGTVNAEKLLPKSRDYYRFNGSLTTPPCSEGVRWFVMKKSIKASPTQIDALKTVLKTDNNRPLQAVNARPILH